MVQEQPNRQAAGFGRWQLAVDCWPISSGGFHLVIAIVGSFILLKLIDFTIGLRVSEQEEQEGLDVTQHGEEGTSTTNKFHPLLTTGFTRPARQRAGRVVFTCDFAPWETGGLF